MATTSRNTSLTCPGVSGEESVRNFSAAIVRFEDGGRISRLSLPSDLLYPADPAKCCSVRKEGLPLCITAAIVCGLVRQLDLPCTEKDVHIESFPREHCCTAHISFPNLRDAKRFCDILDMDLDNIQAVPTSARLPWWILTRRAYSVIKVKWERPLPTASAILTRGTTVQVFYNSTARGSISRDGNTRTLPSDIKISQFRHCEGGHSWAEMENLPRWITEEEITNCLWAGRAALVNLRRDEARWEKGAHQRVLSYLKMFGPLSAVSALDQRRANCWSLHFRYRTDHDTRRIFEEVSRRPLDIITKVRTPRVKLLHCATLEVVQEIFTALEATFTEWAGCWRVGKVSVKKENISARYVRVSVQGRDKNVVLIAIDGYERLFAGRLIEDKESRPLWHPDLEQHAALSGDLRMIQQSFAGSLILLNQSRREIRYFGAERPFVQVRNAIHQLLERRPVRAYIELSNDGFAWALRDGVNWLRAIYPEAEISLNLTTSPKRLYYYASATDDDWVLRILREFAPGFNLNFLATQTECTTCWTPTEKPIKLNCGHIYCSECFEGLCNTINSPPNFVITCKGDNDTCGKPIPLAQIQKHLPCAAFQKILESAFKAQISRLSDEYHCCPTPNCKFVYRPTSPETPWSEKCPRCLEIICTSCRAQHAGQTCKMYRRDQETDQSFVNYKLANHDTVKDCPKCKITVEKTEGCNHILCNCGAHFCWVCLAIFDDHNECYDHMEEVHGGIGGNWVWDEDDMLYMERPHAQWEANLPVRNALDPGPVGPAPPAELPLPPRLAPLADRRPPMNLGVVNFPEEIHAVPVPVPGRQQPRLRIEIPPRRPLRQVRRNGIAGQLDHPRNVAAAVEGELPDLELPPPAPHPDRAPARR